MISLTEDQKNRLIIRNLERIGDKYPKEHTCESFVKDAYREIGIDCIFNDCPKLSFEDIFKEEWIGYICFLRHKIHCPERRYTHVGIIAPNQSLLHYSRYFGEPNVREVFLTPYKEIFEVYNFVY